MDNKVTEFICKDCFHVIKIKNVEGKPTIIEVGDVFTPEWGFCRISIQELFEALAEAGFPTPKRG